MLVAALVAVAAASLVLAVLSYAWPERDELGPIESDGLLPMGFRDVPGAAPLKIYAARPREEPTLTLPILLSKFRGRPRVKAAAAPRRSPVPRAELPRYAEEQCTRCGGRRLTWIVRNGLWVGICLRGGHEWTSGVSGGGWEKGQA